MQGLLLHRLVLPDILNGHETWSVALKEECTLRVFPNRVVWRIFPCKRRLRRMCDEKLQNLYSFLEYNWKEKMYESCSTRVKVVK